MTLSAEIIQFPETEPHEIQYVEKSIKVLCTVSVYNENHPVNRMILIYAEGERL